MQQNYQDAMAMVRKFGRPDLFVTFTSNPSWPEILNAMQGRERTENRPDIVVRVFKMKLSELLDDLIKRKVFGSNMGVSWGGSRDFEPRSDDEDATLAGTSSPSFGTKPAEGHLAKGGEKRVIIYVFL
ncbi:hypothetical protein AVEN_239862-1 [Araneus ventricosus]|uniref:Helitron helicase-like domain-containing protein n=1 Tax=Araneus ventricosus TaxID=182803 RepID=A0A4Y2F9N7_ARAVE|nr:hypothetical protein AVEN_239862-1 [Araneus ventricosus]